MPCYANASENAMRYRVFANKKATIRGSAKVPQQLSRNNLLRWKASADSALLALPLSPHAGSTEVPTTGFQLQQVCRLSQAEYQDMSSRSASVPLFDVDLCLSRQTPHITAQSQATRIQNPFEIWEQHTLKPNPSKPTLSIPKPIETPDPKLAKPF